MVEKLSGLGRMSPARQPNDLYCPRLPVDSGFMRELGVDPKVVADLMGHDVDVNLNVYTQTSLDTRFKAMETLESAFVD
jgi:hypothetical protein